MCPTIVPAGEIWPWVVTPAAPVPRRSRLRPAVHQRRARWAGHPFGAGSQWQWPSARFPQPSSVAQQSPGAWRGGARSRGRAGGEETELGAVNRFAFYGVREFISGHSPDGCNKLVKCDPPLGARALARLRERRGVGIPGHSPDIPLIPHPLPPASQRWRRAGRGDQPLLSGGLVMVGAGLHLGLCTGLVALQGDSFQPCSKVGLLGSMPSLRGEHVGVQLLLLSAWL